MRQDSVTQHRKKRTLTGRDSREVIFAKLKPLARVIREAIGQHCEVLIHDFSDLEHSIICIEGDVTGRRVGGPITDLGLAKVRAGETEDLYNYTTYTEDGRTLRSCSAFLHDEDGEVFGALCINIDITQFLAFQHVLRDYCRRDDVNGVEESFSDDINEILNSMFEEAVFEIGRPPSHMSKQEKVQLVGDLDNKGAFQVKKAVPFVAGRLGVSRYTIYNYLNEAHQQQDDNTVAARES